MALSSMFSWIFELGNDNRFPLVEFELLRCKWSSLREEGGSASSVPQRLRRLIYAKTGEEAKRAYFQLENYVVVQGAIFDCTPHVVQVLLASLVYETSVDVRIWVTELLFQILNGSTHSAEFARGKRNIEAECKERARSGLLLLYQDIARGNPTMSIETVKLVDPDKTRVEFVEKTTQLQA